LKERRIKTEEPLTDNDAASALKKNSKLKNHNKSIQAPIHKLAQLPKKSQSFAKTAQAFKSTQPKKTAD